MSTTSGKYMDVNMTATESDLSLWDIIRFFNNPINEEQAWAVCFQCAQYYLRNPSHDQYQVLVEHGLQSMFLNTGGDVLIHCFESNDCERDVLERHINMTRKKGVAEVDGVQSLGRVTFEALNYGIDEAKKHPLSHELETNRLYDTLLV